MTREEALDKLCHSYSGYFDVVRHEEPKGYLVAEAGLHIHSEKYVLVKAAKLWEADNNEYVYIFSAPRAHEGDLRAVPRAGACRRHAADRAGPESYVLLYHGDLLV